MSSKSVRDVSAAMWEKYHPFKRESEKIASSFLLSEARGVAHEIAQELISRFGATRVVAFGSLARGDFGSRSDIDLAAWGIPPAEYYRAVAFASGFSSSWKVDLVDAEDCPASLRDVILREGVAA